MAREDDGAGAGGLRVVHLVEVLEAFLLVGLAQLLGQVVLADAAEVSRGALREDVLGAARGVLRGTARDVGDRVLLDDVVVDRLAGRESGVDGEVGTKQAIETESASAQSRLA